MLSRHLSFANNHACTVPNWIDINDPTVVDLFSGTPSEDTQALAAINFYGTILEATASLDNRNGPDRTSGICIICMDGALAMLPTDGAAQ